MSLALSDFMACQRLVMWPSHVVEWFPIGAHALPGNHHHLARSGEFRQSQKQRPEANPADRGSRSVVRLSYLIGIVGAIICAHSVPSATIRPQAVASSTGLIVMWCGIGLRLWSFQTLGRYFTFTVQTSQDQPVISAGPYRVIRHPGYAGVQDSVLETRGAQELLDESTTPDSGGFFPFDSVSRFRR